MTNKESTLPPAGSHPPIKHDEVIERLMNENKQYLGLLEDIRLMLAMEPEFGGLSICGGVKALIKKFHETKDLNDDLQIKIMKLKNRP